MLFWGYIFIYSLFIGQWGYYIFINLLYYQYQYYKVFLLMVSLKIISFGYYLTGTKDVEVTVRTIAVFATPHWSQKFQIVTITIYIHLCITRWKSNCDCPTSVCVHSLTNFSICQCEHVIFFIRCIRSTIAIHSSFVCVGGWRVVCVWVGEGGG